MSALAQPEVGQYLNRHFVSAFQKVATFDIHGFIKQGGNVAGYFCTPEGRVLHAVAGPVSGARFLDEARWANDTYQLAVLDKRSPAEVQLFFRKAHLERLQHKHNIRMPEDRLPRPDAVTAKMLDEIMALNARLPLDEQGKVHFLLAAGAMPRLDQVYRVVFERILFENISTRPVEAVGRR